MRTPGALRSDDERGRAGRGRRAARRSRPGAATSEGALGTNWAGNHTYRAARLERPTSVEQLCALVASTPAVRALGSRHSFSDLADTTGTLVDLSALPAGIRMLEDGEGAVAVSVGGGTRYGDLAVALQNQGHALAAMASLPHISVAGAVATGTHGSGDGRGRWPPPCARSRSSAPGVPSGGLNGGRRTSTDWSSPSARSAW